MSVALLAPFAEIDASVAASPIVASLHRSSSFGATHMGAFVHWTGAKALILRPGGEASILPLQNAAKGRSRAEIAFRNRPPELMRTTEPQA
jgi:hypothetical protein